MKNLAHSIFKELQNKLVINCYKHSEIENLPCVDFTYHSGIKSWSHSVSLAYDNEKVYLFTSRMMNNEELKDFLFSKLGDRESIYKIEIKNTSEAIDFLRKYDRFQYKF